MPAKLTMSVIEARANWPRPASNSVRYMKWWRARTALDLPVKDGMPSQNKLLKGNR